MAHAVSTVDAPKPWSGGDAPFNISWGKMMMWFFLEHEPRVLAESR
jgi:hypothetical protein